MIHVKPLFFASEPSFEGDFGQWLSLALHFPFLQVLRKRLPGGNLADRAGGFHTEPIGDSKPLQRLVTVQTFHSMSMVAELHRLAGDGEPGGAGIKGVGIRGLLLPVL